VYHDPFWSDDGSSSLEQVLAEADVLFVGTPHDAYRGLAAPRGRVVVDVWTVLRDGGSGGRPSPLRAKGAL
jgi:hypothetical protein